MKYHEQNPGTKQSDDRLLSTHCNSYLPLHTHPLLAMKQHRELTKRKWLVRSEKSKLRYNRITAAKKYLHFFKENEK